MPPPNAPFPPVEMRGTSPAVDGNDARSPIPRDEIDSPRAISSTPPGHSSSELPRGDATNLAGRIRKTNSSSARGVANLTPEQLARKRANDRQAQRAIRERTKAQIEALEQKVQELSSQQPYQDLQKAIAEKNAIQAENDNIKKRLVMVMETIQPLLDKPGELDYSTGPVSNAVCKLTRNHKIFHRSQQVELAVHSEALSKSPLSDDRTLPGHSSQS